MTDNKFTLYVSIIIVNYNTRKLLADCLNSIYEHTKDINFEVIVSDNGSKYGSIEMLKKDFPQVILIENNANLGFGIANNRGLAIAKVKYIFYLNSDTILLNNAVKIFFDYWEENSEKENIRALGCNLQDINGNILHSYDESPIFRLPLRKVMHDTILYKKHVGPIGAIVGADLFLKNDCFAKFDEIFFMYCEETDLLFQITSNGKKLYLIDGPEIIHFEGMSAEKEYYEVIDQATFSNLNYLLSQIIFFKKNKLATKGELRRLKLFTFLFWINPLISRSTKSYRKKLCKECFTTF